MISVRKICVLSMVGVGAAFMPRVAARAQSAEVAKSADAFVETIGVATHIRYASSTMYATVLKPLLIQSGIRYIRDGAVGVARQLTELAAYGIHSTIVMDPRDGVDPATVVEAVITPALKSIIAIEGPNEWDLSRTLEWKGQRFPEGERAFQSALYSAVKNAANPAIRALPVLAPSIGRPEQSIVLGSVPCDEGNMHSYQGGKLPGDQLTTRWMPNAQLLSGSKPIVVTETGYNYDLATGAAGQPGVSETAAAKYVPRVYLENYLHGIARTHIYVMFPDAQWGMIDAGGKPRLSYFAVKNLIALLADPGKGSGFAPGTLRYMLSGNSPATHHLLLQKRDGRFYLIVWLDAPSFDPATRVDLNPTQAVTVTFQTPVRRINTYLPSQSAAAQSTVAAPTSLALNVPDQPLIIEITPR